MRRALRPLRRPAAERVALFDDQRVIAGLGRLQRGGEPRDAAADHQHRARDFAERGGRRRLGPRHLSRRHADLVGGEHLRVLRPRGLRPRDLFAQVRAHHGDAVEAEAIGHHARRTGADDEPIDRAFLDVASDFGDALGRAQALRARRSGRCGIRSWRPSPGRRRRRCRRCRSPCRGRRRVFSRTRLPSPFSRRRRRPSPRHAPLTACTAFSAAAVADCTDIETSSGPAATPAEKMPAPSPSCGVRKPYSSTTRSNGGR